MSNYRQRISKNPFVLTFSALSLCLCACSAENPSAFNAGLDANDAQTEQAALEGADEGASVGQKWVSTWASAPEPPGLPFLPNDPSVRGFTNQTVRQLAHISLGGQRLRVRFSNAHGERPLLVGHASVALPRLAPLADLVPGSQRELTFRGRKQITIPRGAEVISDPIYFPLGAARDVVVSTYLPGPTGPITWHFTALQSTYVSSAGDQVSSASASAFPTTLSSSFVVSGIDVQTHGQASAIVALGDSITDGYGSTEDLNRRWPDRLAERVSSRRQAVVNVGISGNQLLKDGSEVGLPAIGINALARLPRDVLSKSGVQTLIVLEGINDIHEPDSTAEAMIATLQQIAAQAHAAGVRVLGGTIGPSEGVDSGHTPEQEALRSTVNAYVRNNVDFDGVVDFDAALRDPAHPSRLLPVNDSGDHLHPSDVGFQAMANAVPLRLLH